MAGGDDTLEWDGRNDAGKPAPDGRYTVTLTPRDLAGNAGKPETIEIDVYAALSRRDPDRRRSSSPRMATRWPRSRRPPSPCFAGQRHDPGRRQGRHRGPHRDDGQVAPGRPCDVGVERQDRWRRLRPARRATGSSLPRPTARSGPRSGSRSTRMRSASPRPSLTAVRGTAFKVTAVSAERLSTAPRIVVRQPGLEPWSVRMTKLSSTTWTAVVKPRKGGDGRHADPGRQGDRLEGRRQCEHDPGWSSSSASQRAAVCGARSGLTPSANGGLHRVSIMEVSIPPSPAGASRRRPTVAMRTARGHSLQRRMEILRRPTAGLDASCGAGNPVTRPRAGNLSSDTRAGALRRSGR